MAAINNFTKEILSKASKIANFNQQDDIYHPEAYNDIVSKSTMLNTPIGDRFVVFQAFLNRNEQTFLYNQVSSFESQTANLETFSFTIQDPVITVAQPREVIRTKVKGLDGDIVEIMQNGSYEISITGSFAGNAYWLYDVDSLKLLETVCNSKLSLEVLSPYLNDVYNITDLVVLDHKISQSTEYTNITNIEISCISTNNKNIFENIKFDIEPLKQPSFQSTIGG
jgi:hypothetical protein